MIGHKELVNILTRLGQGNGSWTLHAGGAIVYHLNHRPLDEIDLYANRQIPRTQLLDDAAEMLSTFLPNDKAWEVRQLFDKCFTGTVKVAFERAVFSFVLTPKCRTIAQRFSYNGHLFVASLFDSIGAKMMGLHDRNKRSDYIDIAASIKRGFSANELTKALMSVAPHDVDILMLFNKMRWVPLSIKDTLTAEEISLLQGMALEGLNHADSEVLKQTTIDNGIMAL